jgi:hypothetical protein
MVSSNLATSCFLTVYNANDGMALGSRPFSPRLGGNAAESSLISLAKIHDGTAQANLASSFRASFKAKFQAP